MRRRLHCFGCRVPSGEINVPRRQAIISHFPALYGHDLRLGSPSTKSISNLWENGEGPSSPGHVGGGWGMEDPAPLGSPSAVSRQHQGPRGEVGCQFQSKQAPGSPGILTWPSTVGGEDTERRVVLGSEWEDLGPPPQKACFPKVLLTLCTALLPLSVKWGSNTPSYCCEV